MCHAKSLHIYLLHRIYSVMNYSSVTQDIMSRIAIHYYTLQVYLVKYAICYMYFMSRNIHCHMLHHVKKCCLLYGMPCYEMLHVTCMPCYEMYSVTFMS